MDGIGDCSCTSVAPLAARFTKIFPGIHGYDPTTGVDGVMVDVPGHGAINQPVYTWMVGFVQHIYFPGDSEGDPYGLSVPALLSGCSIVPAYRHNHGTLVGDVYTDGEIPGSWVDGLWAPTTPIPGGSNSNFYQDAEDGYSFWCGHLATTRYPEGCAMGTYGLTTPTHWLKQTIVEHFVRYIEWPTTQTCEFTRTTVRTRNRWTGEYHEEVTYDGTEGPPDWPGVDTEHWVMTAFETSVKTESHLKYVQRFDFVGVLSAYEQLDYEETLENPYTILDYLDDCQALYDVLTIPQMIERFNSRHKVRFEVCYDSDGNVSVTEANEEKTCCDFPCPIHIGDNPFFYYAPTYTPSEPYSCFVERHIRGNLYNSGDVGLMAIDHGNFPFYGTKAALVIDPDENEDGWIQPTELDYEIYNFHATYCSPFDLPITDDGFGTNWWCRGGPPIGGHSSTHEDIDITQDGSMEIIQGLDDEAQTSQYLGLQCDEDNEVIILHPKAP
jgi:hypothetical protein